MTQSQFLFGAFIVAFLVWITTKGELKTYAGFFTVSNSAGNGTSSTSGNSITQIGSALLGGGGSEGLNSNIPSSSSVNPMLPYPAQGSSDNPLLQGIPGVGGGLNGT